MKWQFWKRTKPPKRGRPAKSPIANLEQRVKKLMERMGALEGQVRHLDSEEITTANLLSELESLVEALVKFAKGENVTFENDPDDIAKDADDDEDEIASIIDREMHT